MTKEIPKWAKQRACDLVNACRGVHSSKYYPPMANASTSPTLHVLARYIAKHEEPTVDPLLVEAREVCAQCARFSHYKEGYISGAFDDDSAVQVALAALKRGIEMGEMK